MNRCCHWRLAIALLAAAAAQLTSSSVSNAAERLAMGPLRAHPDNPRYFIDSADKPVWLTGSHTWANRQERGVVGQTPDFDYDRYLDFLKSHGHNFIRLWVWEHAQWMQFVPRDTPIRYAPLPWKRSGPGLALDGQPRFDLTQFDDAYFQRLRTRVVKARKRGIYIGVMLFQGFSLDKRRGNDKMGNAWRGHPFHRSNNVNNIDGNPSGDESGRESHTLEIPTVTRLQEAYVRKTIDTINDLDNVLWEIGNECHQGSVEWQYHMIHFIRQYELTKANQFVVGMTGAPIGEQDLANSPADWISPPGRKWLDDPPAASGSQVIVVDNDHGAPWDHKPAWVWKNLLRGNHLILMDGYMDYRIESPRQPDPAWDPMRRTMGLACRLARDLDLVSLRPYGELASTGFCLANPGRAYLVYQATRGEFRLELASGDYHLRWIDPLTGRTTATARQKGTGDAVTLVPPGDGDVLLYVTAN